MSFAACDVSKSQGTIPWVIAVGLTARKEEVLLFGEPLEASAEASISRGKLERDARPVSDQILPDTSPDGSNARALAEGTQLKP